MSTHDKISHLIDKIESSPAMDIAGRSKHIHDLRAAVEADRQQRVVLECEVRERGFLYENGKHTPTLLLAFPIDDWDSRDRLAAMLAAAPKFGEEEWTTENC